jgi:hypothetical protein
MPLAIPNPQQGGVPARPESLYVRQTQDWAIVQERQRHDEALLFLGEYAFIALMWHLVDFEMGLIGRCQTCYNTGNSINDQITAVYNQPTKYLCPDCYGTTFEGGIRALLVRPFMFADADESEKQDRRGSVHPQALSGETTWDFRSYEGDYVFRQDGTRYRVLTQPRRTTIRTGFAHPAQRQASLGYGRLSLGYEEPNTVAYIIPPSGESISAMLDITGLQQPIDWSRVEVINGPLITGDGTLTADPDQHEYPRSSLYPGSVTMTGSGWGD